GAGRRALCEVYWPFDRMRSPDAWAAATPAKRMRTSEVTARTTESVRMRWLVCWLMLFSDLHGGCQKLDCRDDAVLARKRVNIVRSASCQTVALLTLTVRLNGRGSALGPP